MATIYYSFKKEKMKLLEIYLLISPISFTFELNYIPLYMKQNFTPAEDFCDKIPCKKQNHPYCHNDTYKPAAGEIKVKPFKIYLDPDKKIQMLGLQNMYRDLIACSNGKLVNLNKEHLPNAAKMHQLQWDNELEFVSAEIGRTCRVDLTYCGTTANYPDAGFIMSERAYSTFMSHLDVVEDIILSWFTSYINVPLKTIGKYEENQPIRKTMYNFSDMELWDIREMGAHRKHILKIYHFLQLVQDDATKVGCSFYICGRINGRIQYLYVCVYDRKNKEGNPVFKGHRKAARLCDKVSAKHCCLCATGDTNTTVANDTNVQCQSPELDFEVADFKSGDERLKGIISIFMFIIYLFVL